MKLMEKLQEKDHEMTTLEANIEEKKVLDNEEMRSKFAKRERKEK
mgnify:CR=1 FL=1